MNKKCLAALVSAVLVTMSGYAFSATGQAIELDPNKGFVELLSDNVGKRVAFRLGSGEEIEGTVVKVGKSLVHVAKITGREFYDAVISIDKISAVRMRVREQ